MKPGEIVLDPMMGGVTTGVVCKRLECDFIGIELNQETYLIAEGRLKALT